jgi:hypothetical protein
MSFHCGSHSEEVRQAAIETFKHGVTTELEKHSHAKRKIIERGALVQAPIGATIKADPSAASALKALSPLIEEERYRFEQAAASTKPNGPRTFSLTTNGGLVLSVPPYDLQWTTGVFDEADLKTGTFTARTVDSVGYQAAGVGLFVRSNIAEAVRFSADAEFHSTWTNLVLEGAAFTEGGIGVIVHEGGNVVARRDARLWTDSRSGVGWLGASGDDVTLLTQTSAGQTYFNMLPGRTYAVWIWCWIRAGSLGTALAVGNIHARVPFVVVEQQRR